jgi:hypothetical protein
MFGKKDGFHCIELLNGYKLKDILEYPTAMQEKIFGSFQDKEYIVV